MTDPGAASLRELGARELAGYRVLRSLARDEDADVLLGHRIDQGATQTVAVKTSPATDDAWRLALRACSALDRARGDHVVDLIDVDADAESIRLIFERLSRGDLAELLRTRRTLDAGEAVTILAPIAVALLRMHRAGVAHGRVSGATVLFRDDGSPTLIGFSQAELFEPDAPEVVLEQIAAVGRDRAAARSLALEVLARAEGARAHAARELMAELQGCGDELVLPLLTSRLFEVAAARPVRFIVDEPPTEIAPSNWRPIPIGSLDDERASDAADESPSRWAVALGRIVPEPLLERVLDVAGRSPAAPVVTAAVDAATSRWRAWTPGRRRAVLAVAAAAATVGIVTAVVPAGAVATGRAPSAGSSAESPAPRSNPGTAMSDDPARDPAPPDPAPSEPAPDDPVQAAESLVTARTRCLSTLSLRCLDQVDESGSSALNDDQAAIRGAQRGGELPDPALGTTGSVPPELIERLGDSALVRLGGAASSASLLLVKVDGAWRIRDVIDAGATPTARPDSSGG